MEINSEIGRLIKERLEIAENDYKIISAKDCYSGSIYFSIMENALKELDDKASIEKVIREIDKVIDRISEFDTQKINHKDNPDIHSMERVYQTNREVTIEMYRRFGISCFYGDYLVYADEGYYEKKITMKDLCGLIYAMAVIEEENHKIIDAERTCKSFAIFNEDPCGFNHAKYDLSETRDRIIKKLIEFNALDIERLNDKESMYRSHIPLDLQTNKKITIEEYHKNGEKCFYKNMEDNLEV